MVVIVVAILLFHILISWLIVFVLDFGLLGASITLSISWWALILSTWLYIILSPSCRATWTDLCQGLHRHLTLFQTYCFINRHAVGAVSTNDLTQEKSRQVDGLT
ncbi:protein DETOXIFICATION 41-like [Zingiber officinale]|uniref:protein DETOXIFICATION 41-like n=1 Tax=Zingiber officinale TaxID=94328 RepID=UPI001C4A80D2|nr:protein DETOXIFICATION 41-like [Zingiber officinale]